MLKTVWGDSVSLHGLCNKVCSAPVGWTTHQPISARRVGGFEVADNRARQQGMIRTFKAPRFLKMLFACSFAVWLTAAGVSFHYDGSRPEAPIPERGQIYELNTHGHVVYLSFRDGLLFYGMMLVASAGMLTALAIALRFRESRPSSPARYQQ